MNDDLKRIFFDGLNEMGIDAAHENAEKVIEYIDLMLEKNQVMNLSAIREPEAAVRLHGLDALALLGCIDLSGKKVLDVGTGGGVPGALLALSCPEADVTMIDSTAKKLNFVEQTCNALGANAHFYAGRAEMLAHGDMRAAFDVVTARAVAALPLLCELCLPFVKTGGVFAAYKANAQDEIKSSERAVSALGGRILQTYGYKIPGEDVTRCIILIKKIKPSPDIYPRQWSKIKAKPL